MKNLILLVYCLAAMTVHGQDSTKAGFDGHKWEAPYQLSIPKDWAIERFLIPISFAPQISYKGVEDIRFAPGWANAKTDEYWTYAFLWWLEGNIKTAPAIIENNLKAYYAGLVKINGSKIPAEKFVPVTTSFKEAQTHKGDLKTYNGKIDMLDYMSQQPITLNCIVHVKSCPEEKRTLMFYELSPKSFSHKVWSSLDKLWLGFRCQKS